MEVTNKNTGSIFKLIENDTEFGSDFEKNKKDQLITIAWNTGDDQKINVDGSQFIFCKDSITTFTSSESFSFSNASDIIAWQFNRSFYCIIEHDSEVSCAGLIFYGHADHLVIKLDDKEKRKIELLYSVFRDEYDERDNLQEDMLRMLLKRLIIKITRLYKQQNNVLSVVTEDLDIVRQFNLLVDKQFKEWHQVQDYAHELNKSPKTLSNLFSKLNSTSPLKIIHNRIILEAKRLLIYTDFTIKEIAYELGFQEVPPFNRLFKKVIHITPSEFRKTTKT